MNKGIRFGLIAFAAVGVCLGAGMARAGEVTGQGNYIFGSPDAPLKGKSSCAYSGRQDNYEEDVTPLGPFFTSMIVQNWGVVADIFKEIILGPESHPGVACNPHRSSGGAA